MPRPKKQKTAETAPAGDAAAEAPVAASADAPAAGATGAAAAAAPAAEPNAPADGAADAPVVKQKKKRDNNPGIRVQGGRIYDSEKGTTCHQCRQKTVEVKAKCTQCPMYWCPRCLSNRYGQQVAEVSKLDVWACPRCDGKCNCSNCRKRQGLAATGILAGVSKAAGFGSVSALLDKNPNATRPPTVAEGGGGAGAPRPRQRSRSKAGAGGGGEDGAGAAGPLRGGRELEMVPDADLPPRAAPLPAAGPLAVHRPPRASGGRSASGGGSGANASTRSAAWPRGAPDALPIPAGLEEGDLAEVLEFAAAFGGGRARAREANVAATVAAVKAGAPAPPEQQALDIPVLCPAVLAAELVAPPASGSSPAVDAPGSAVAALHIALLDAVRRDWGIPGTVGSDGWHAVMRQYLREDVRAQREAAAGRGDGGGEEGGATNASPSKADAPTLSADGAAAGGEGAGDEAGSGDAADPANPLDADPDAAYPPPGYWGLPPAARLRMLRELMHDALDTAVARAQIEGAAEHAGAADRAVREELAAARRDAKAAWAKQRDLTIGEMLARADLSSMTADEQRALVAETKAKVEAAASAEAAGRVRALAARAARGGREVRAVPLGKDRDGNAYFDLDGVTAALAGADAGPALLVCRPPPGDRDQAAVDGGEVPPSLLAGDGRWGVVTDGPALAAALDARGEAEGPLRVEVMSRFGLSEAAEKAAAGPAAAEPAEPAEPAAAEPAAATAGGRGPAPRRGRPPKGAAAAAPKKRGTKRAPKPSADVPADAAVTVAASPPAKKGRPASAGAAGKKAAAVQEQRVSPRRAGAAGA